MHNREKEIMYIIFISKIENTKDTEFLDFFNILKLSNKEKEILNTYKDISKKEIESIIPKC